MLILALVLVFVGVVATGPAGQEWLEKRREYRERPLAKVVYLPTNACRTGGWTPDQEYRQHVERHKKAGCAMLSYCEICDGDSGADDL